MKKVTLFIVMMCTMLITSCTSPEKKISNQFYESIKTNLIDPTSYTFISLEKQKQQNNPNFGFILKDPSFVRGNMEWIGVYNTAKWQKDNPTKKTIVYTIKFRSKSKLGLDVLGTYELYVSEDNQLLGYKNMD